MISTRKGCLVAACQAARAVRHRSQPPDCISWHIIRAPGFSIPFAEYWTQYGKWLCPNTRLIDIARASFCFFGCEHEPDVRILAVEAIHPSCHLAHRPPPLRRVALLPSILGRATPSLSRESSQSQEHLVPAEHAHPSRRPIELFPVQVRDDNAWTIRRYGNYIRAVVHLFLTLTSGIFLRSDKQALIITH